MERKHWNTTAIHIHNNPVKSIGGGTNLHFKHYPGFNCGEDQWWTSLLSQGRWCSISSPPSFVRCWDSFTKEIADTPDKGTVERGIKQADYTLRKFIGAIIERQGYAPFWVIMRMRSATSSILGSHQTSVWRDSAGLDQWNDDRTLSSTGWNVRTKSIKEIAEVQLPQSVLFGKYVKMHLGDFTG